MLDKDPENAEAYLGKLMAELKVRRREDLKNQAQPFDYSKNYSKVIRFADKKTVDELTGYITYINTRNIYDQASHVMRSATAESMLRKASEMFKSIQGWKDADKLAAECDEKADREKRERAEKAAREERERAEKAAEKEAARQRKITNIKNEKAALQTELSNLKGLFSGKRRREIEARLALLDSALKNL